MDKEHIDQQAGGIIDYVKKHQKDIALSAMVVILIAPILIWLAYYIGSRIGGVYTDISADGILGYVIGAIGALVSAMVSIIAITLSNRANELSNRLMLLEEEKYKLDMRPFVLLTGWSAYGKTKREITESNQAFICVNADEEQDFACLAIMLTNTTQSFISVQYASAEDMETKTRWGKSGTPKAFRSLGLGPGQSGEIVFYAGSSFFPNSVSHTINMNLALENRFGERYSEQFDLSILDYDDDVLQVLKDEESWTCDIIAQRYRIGKWVEQDDGEMDLVHESIKP